MASFSTQFRRLVLRINSNAYSLYYKAPWAGSFLVRFLSLVPFRFVYLQYVTFYRDRNNMQKTIVF